MLLPNTMHPKKCTLGSAKASLLAIFRLVQVNEYQVPTGTSSYGSSPQTPCPQPLMRSNLVLFQSVKKKHCGSLLLFILQFDGQGREPRCCPESSWKYEHLVQKQRQSSAPGSQRRERNCRGSETGDRRSKER